MRNVILVGILDFDNSKYNFVILHAKYYIYIFIWEDIRIIDQTIMFLLNFWILVVYRETGKYIAVKNDKLKQWSIYIDGII